MFSDLSVFASLEMSWTRDFFTLSAHQKPNVGDTKTTVVSVDHLGWLLCDGRLVQKSEYGLLFYQIGYTFGGSDDEFRLPDGRGRVIGNTGISVGTNWAYGQTTGEEEHLMTLSELVAHNHGTDASSLIPGNNLTGAAGGHTHTINDPGHTHSYVNQPNVQNTDNALSTESAANNENVNQTTGSSATGITINSVADHQHTIATQGGSQPFNVMQPTIFMGNLFIYSGKTNAGAWPYTIGTNVA